MAGLAGAVGPWRVAAGWGRGTFRPASALALAAVVAFAASCGGDGAPGAGVGRPGEAVTPGRAATEGPVSRLTRNQALHIPVRDGVRIAVDVWLPDGTREGVLLPTMIRATRYWRARGLVDAPLEDDSNFGEAERWNAAGYALVLVDGRGSGASFGIRRFELAEDEVRDYGEVADWIVAQPWSNGRVGAYGVSYAGNTAEICGRCSDGLRRCPSCRGVDGGGYDTDPTMRPVDSWEHTATSHARTSR